MSQRQCGGFFDMHTNFWITIEDANDDDAFTASSWSDSQAGVPGAAWPDGDGAAKALGVSRVALSELINGRRGISPEMAIRLAKAFGSRAEIWAGLQMQYDLAQALRNSDAIKVSRVA
jgi:addiction module HigA family antidote